MPKTSRKKVSRRDPQGQKPLARARQALQKTRTRTVPRAVIDDATLAVNDQFRAIQYVRNWKSLIIIWQFLNADIFFMVDKDGRNQASGVPRPRASSSWSSCYHERLIKRTFPRWICSYLICHSKLTILHRSTFLAGFSKLEVCFPFPLHRYSPPSPESHLRSSKQVCSVLYQYALYQVFLDSDMV